MCGRFAPIAFLKPHIRGYVKQSEKALLLACFDPVGGGTRHTHRPQLRHFAFHTPRTNPECTTALPPTFRFPGADVVQFVWESEVGNWDIPWSLFSSVHPCYLAWTLLGIILFLRSLYSKFTHAVIRIHSFSDTKGGVAFYPRPKGSASHYTQVTYHGMVWQSA